jgi:hypothetical protein
VKVTLKRGRAVVLAECRQVEILLLKLFCAPTLVVTSSLAGRRWGASLSGILVALPIVAGPILFITYLQHGSSFAAGAAEASLLGLVSLALFAVVFARISRRLGWLPTLTAGWAATLVADVCLSQLHVPAVAGLALTVSATLAALWLMPRAKTAPVLSTAPNWPWWDLPGRATATGVLVLTITTASSALGPHLTGVLAPFPIAVSVVAAFVLAQKGPVPTAATLAGALTGLFGFAAFCFCVAILVPLLGVGAFGIAALATVTVQLLVVQLRGRLHSRAPANRLRTVRAIDTHE